MNIHAHYVIVTRTYICIASCVYALMSQIQSALNLLHRHLAASQLKLFGTYVISKFSPPRTPTVRHA